jgi:hypothetical protein
VIGSGDWLPVLVVRLVKIGVPFGGHTASGGCKDPFLLLCVVSC